jgi:ABC-2 type transport system permease protein
MCSSRSLEDTFVTARYDALIEVTKWRVREFMREPEALFWVFAFPLILSVALGIAFKDRGPPRVRILVESGPGAEQLADSLSRDSRLEARVADPEEARQALRTGRTPLVVQPGDPVTFRFDSTRQESLVARLVTERALFRREEASESIREIHSSEPGARYIDFLIPGLLGMNIMGTGIWGVGFGIVQTRSRRLLKRFAASPMRKSDYLLGQVFARLVFLAFETATVLSFGHFVFGVPFKGSIVGVLITVVLGAMTFAGLGLLIASRVRTIEGASGLMNVVMMPMWIVSGVFFAYSNFPEGAQPFIRALPLTALNDSLRAILLDGSSLLSQVPSLGVMMAWGLASFGTALAIFRWT